MMRYLFVLLISLSFTCLSFGQKKKVKFGSISKEELAMQSCPFDAEAGAVVLSDVGQLWFDLNIQGRFDIIIERHVRIKIFNQNGYDQADVEIPFYTGEKDQASITSFKAKTIVPNGKEYEEHKVDKSAIFDEKYNDYYAGIKFTFPKIDDGVIIEYKYQLTTPFTHAMRIWEFQQEIPVMYATYQARIPEYYDCLVNVVGHSSKSISYESSSQSDDGYINNIHQFVGKDIPAMRRERYGNNIRNFTTKVRTVVRSYQVPGYFVETVAGTYEEINKNLMERDVFHQLEQKNNYLDDILSKIKRSDLPTEDIQNIVAYVKANTSYEGYQSFYPNITNKMALSGSSSNSAAMNMLLTCLVKKAGYQADAVILGTRDYLKPHPFTPDFNDFNHLVMLVTSKNKKYLIDATSSIDGGFPESDIFNAEGWIVSKEHPGKVLLTGLGDAKLMASSTWTIMPGESPVSDVEIKSNHLGIQILTEEKYYDGAKYEKWMNDANDDEISDFKNVDENNYANIKFTKLKDVLLGEDIFYFTPDYYGTIDYEIFQREERQTPLDFPYKFNVTNMLSIPIPEGYVFESGPTSKKYSMENDAMNFSYVVKAGENELNVNFRFKVNQTFFLPHEYKNVRAFIRELESTLNEKFVFKKAE